MTDRRVAMLHRGLAGGGIERVMVNLATGLLARGCLVDFVLFRGDGPHIARIPDGARMILLETDRTLLTLAPLVRYLRRERPAAMLSFIPQTNIIAVAAAALAGVETRIAVCDHNHLSSRRKMAPLKDRVAYWLCPAAYRHADRLVAVSRGVADDVAEQYRLPRERMEVIYNPVTGPHIDQAGCRPPNHPWFADGEPPVFLSMGRLTPQKDHAMLLRAFARVRAQRSVRLMILGEGPLRGELERLVTDLGIESSVALPGYVDEPFSYIRRSAAFVLSSRFEGFGNVLVEALACGTPVVSTDCPSGPGEILDSGRFGTLVPVGDEVAMSQAMAAALDAPSAAEELRRRAALFSVVQAAEKYERLLLDAPRAVDGGGSGDLLVSSPSSFRQPAHDHRGEL
jgi:glycosyltransferase involved in cell wall biosynthesis